VCLRGKEDRITLKGKYYWMGDRISIRIHEQVVYTVTMATNISCMSKDHEW